MSGKLSLAAARLLTALLLAPSSLLIAAGALAATAVRMPYAEAGLTRHQAAAVLLDRFTYGAQPGEAEQVVEQGLDHWFEQQLDARLSEAELGTRLSQYPALGMTHQQLRGQKLIRAIYAQNQLRPRRKTLPRRWPGSLSAPNPAGP